MNYQSPRNPNRDSFKTPTWESRDKKPFGCGPHGVAQSILYGERWWLPPSLELPVASPSTKDAPECELTNLLVDLMQVQVSE
jgi:hypothetical protein